MVSLNACQVSFPAKNLHTPQGFTTCAQRAKRWIGEAVCFIATLCSQTVGLSQPPQIKSTRTLSALPLLFLTTWKMLEEQKLET